MKLIKNILVETTFEELLDNAEDSDINIQDIIKQLSDKFESYEFDIKILHSILDILNSCQPNKDDIKDLDVDKIRTLLKFIGLDITGNFNIINVDK